ncbi:MFS general substrate transporter [Dothidotthia symphoricarpi CBS 119687]|uniref:MFS general substrate transporter n=1 Tax=Dothidotthia symphoricarpi CBS 119687 TaxID=1392245 RepID=A0A6A6AMR3_9PLEO|nr:MFS general substrate transporter [Dothidotthia symphoricarpi CBS 119687]KAF2132428.1 MFS general substrate transporter [Dothidotthia symphoricarpi CBS 119687]
MVLQAYISSVLQGSGVFTVLKSSRDVKFLFAQRFFRLFAYGASFLILVQFLTSLGVTDKMVGLFMTLTMLGDALISFVLVLITDQIGRRKILALGAILMTMSGAIFSMSSTYWILVLASVVGVISPSGNEIGPFRAVEESILAQLTDKDDRSDIFAWYTMCGTAGAAIGTVTSGWMVQTVSNAVADKVKPYRFIFVLYAALGIVKLVLVLALSPTVELHDQKHEYQEVIELEDEDLVSHTSSPRKARRTPKSSEVKTVRRLHALLPQISRESLLILFRLILLFALDSFASGMASPSWLTYFFTTFHNVEPATLGTLFFTTNLLATLSNFAALPLARRLGPLKTMAFTHLPSAVFLALVPIPQAGSWGTLVAMTFLSLRACTQSMDQAPRQAFLAAVMRPEERTAILGIINIVKTIAQAGGIGSSGVLAAGRSWRLMLGGAGMMKATYDLLILWTFLGVPDRDMEER